VEVLKAGNKVTLCIFELFFLTFQGPLVGMVNGKITLIGVTSFGLGCAKKPFPGIL